MTPLLARLLVLACFPLACSTASCGVNPFGAAGDSEEDTDPVPSDAVERFRAARCGTYVDCDCGTEADCDRENVMPFARMMEEFDALAFDQDCFEGVIAGLEDPSCDPGPGGRCDLFTGGLGKDEQCVGYYGPGYTASACKTGLRCLSGVCSPPISSGEGRGKGEFCDPEAEIEMCSTFLYCSGTENVCVEELPDGEVCHQARSCGLLSYCEGLAENGSGVCAPLKKLGDPCDADDDERVCELSCDAEGRCTESQCVENICVRPPEGPPPVCAAVEVVGG